MTRPKQLSTEDVILQKLGDFRMLSAHDLAVECALDEAAVRYHLRRLRSRAMIQEFHSATGGYKVGRKAVLYRRVNPDQQKNIVQLCDGLLHHFCEASENSAGGPAVALARLILQTSQTVQSEKAMPLHKLIEWLNNQQYQACWEAGKSGPVLKFTNCPYRDIRNGNDILCQTDVHILRELSKLSWEIVQPIEWTTLQGNCLFVVKAAVNR